MQLYMAPDKLLCFRVGFLFETHMMIVGFCINDRNTGVSRQVSRVQVYEILGVVAE